ncbi:MAG TPA: membrane protein insertase YidC [Fimbriimonadaceae bacterium]|nr:membrane protein insertase YidC [Fimbriimonadaceae bacterium]
MSQPTPKQSFIQTLLLFAVIYLGISLMCPKPPEETRPSEEILSNLRKLNGEYAAGTRDKGEVMQQVLQEHGRLVQKLGSESGNEAIELARRVEGDVLTADVQIKHGILHKDFNAITMGYQMLHGQAPEVTKKPIWNQPFKVAPTKESPATMISAAALKEEAFKQAHELGQHTLVWGLIPGYQLIDFLVRMTGAIPAFSYGFAAFVLAVIVRAIVWPLAQKQYMWGRQMSQLQPLIKDLKDKYTGQELNLKVMELYKEYGINPMAGCGPALLQMPLFIAIYQCMLYYKFEFQKGTFLWINPSTSAATNGFVAPNLGERDYILLVIYGLSMIATTLLTPVADPSNARQQRLMGVGIAVFFTLLMFTGIFPVPAAFVLYWIFTNILATAQSLRAYRLPLPPLEKKNVVSTGGVLPVTKTQPGANGKSTTISNGAFKNTGAPKLHKPKKKRR